MVGERFARIAEGLDCGHIDAGIVERLLDRFRCGQLAASKSIEQALNNAGIDVAAIQALSESRKSFADHLVIIKSALIFAALLVVLVGGLGLMSTLTLNVFERTREIGILSAIGATPRAIARNVLVEGMVMAILSWCLALIAAIP